MAGLNVFLGILCDYLGLRRKGKRRRTGRGGRGVGEGFVIMRERFLVFGGWRGVRLDVRIYTITIITH